MKKELSMEARLLIAFVLMGLVLFLTPYIYKPATAPAPGANKAATSKTTDVKEAATPPPAEVPPPPPLAAAAEIPGQIHADQEEAVTVDTDLYHVVFSNKGAVVKNWVLKDFKDHEGKSLDLVNPAALAKVPAPFSLEFRSQKPTTDANAALYKVDREGDNVTFEFSDGRMDVKKTFEFGKDSYLLRMTSQVSQNGVMLPHDSNGAAGSATKRSRNLRWRNMRCCTIRMRPGPTASLTTSSRKRTRARRRTVRLLRAASTRSRALRMRISPEFFCRRALPRWN